MAFIYDLTDTWNAGGTTFNAIKMNVTDTASAAASKLITVQVSGSEKFSVKKDGVGYFAGNVGIGTSSPSDKLNISSSSNQIGLDTGDQATYGTLDLGHFTNGAFIGTQAGSNSASDLLRFGTSGTERMRITSAGSVGIGTTSPDSAALLDVVSSDGKYIRTKATAADSTTGYILANDARTWIIRANGSNSDALEFRNATSGRQEMVIDTSGRVGIGTTSPGAALDVVTNSSAAGFSLRGRVSDNVSDISLKSNDATTTYGQIQGRSTDLRLQANSTLPVTFYTNSSERMRIDASGNVGIGTSSPGYRLTAAGASTAGSVTAFAIENPSTNAASEVRQEWRAGGSSWGYITTSYNSNSPFMAFGVSASSAAPTERMRIDSSGNVGIGTTSPAAVSGTTALEITGASGGAGAEVVIGSTDTTATTGDLFGGLAFKSIDVNGTPPHYSGIKARAADTFGGADLEFYVGRSNYESNDPRFVIEGPQSVSGEAMRIDSAGNVGIGTSSPGRLLELSSGAPSQRFTDTTNGDYSEISYNSGAFNINVDAGATLASSSFRVFVDSTEAMRITSAGNVGIGTTSPSSRMHIQTAAGTAPKYWIGQAATSAWSVGTPASVNALAFVDEQFSAERMRIDSSGNLLVGTTSNYTAGRSAFYETTSGYWPIATRGVNRGISVDVTDSSGVAIYFTTSSGASGAGQISVSGSSTTYATSSDARLKDNIADAEDAANLIDAIQVRKFDWKADGSHQRYGMVAQELVEVAPEAVSVPQDEDEMMGVDYSKLVPMLVKEIQSMRLRLAQLEG